MENGEWRMESAEQEEGGASILSQLKVVLQHVSRRRERTSAVGHLKVYALWAANGHRTRTGTRHQAPSPGLIIKTHGQGCRNTVHSKKTRSKICQLYFSVLKCIQSQIWDPCSKYIFRTNYNHLRIFIYLYIYIMLTSN